MIRTGDLRRLLLDLPIDTPVVFHDAEREFDGIAEAWRDPRPDAPTAAQRPLHIRLQACAPCPVCRREHADQNTSHAAE